MSERIRYRKVNDRELVSIQEYSHATNGAVYKVYIEKNVVADMLSETKFYTNRYQVIETGSELVAASGANVKLPALQKEIRTALEKLGIELSRGSRVHKTSALEMASTR